MNRSLLVLGLFLCLLPSIAAAKDDRYQEIGGKIMCACGCNQLLLKCNHVGCPDSDRMIRELRTAVDNPSNSDEDVLNWFRRSYGMTVVVSPATHGFELISWVVPPVLAVLTFLLVFWLVYHWRKRGAALQPATSASTPQLDAYRERARKETEI